VQQHAARCLDELERSRVQLVQHLSAQGMRVEVEAHGAAVLLGRVRLMEPRDGRDGKRQ
jgi:hypothetical protein